MARITRMLIDAGAEHLPTDARLTPLHLAVRHQVKALIEGHGAAKKPIDVDAATASRDSPLYLAAQHACADIVRMLIGANANVQIRCPRAKNMTLLECARRQRRKSKENRFERRRYMLSMTIESIEIRLSQRQIQEPQKVTERK
jgi:Ankyrin repeats (3 copies)